MQLTAEIDAEGLRTIGVVPNGRLLRIEGRNGIGKTLFVRLWQLASGDQPFVTLPSAWGTLRSRVKGGVLEVTGLADGRTMRLHLSSGDTWPVAPAPVGEWIGQHFIDDRPTTIDAVRRLLSVVRVGGDESLGASMADLVRADQQRVQRLVDRTSDFATAWQERLRQIHAIVDVAEPNHLRSLNAEKDSAATSLAAVTGELTSLTITMQQHLELRATEDAIVQAESQLPQLTMRREALLLRLEELSDSVSDLDRQAADLLTRERQSKSQRSEARRLESLLAKRLERRHRRQQELRRGLSAAQLAEDSSARDLRLAERELERSLGSAVARRSTIDRTRLTSELIDNLGNVLAIGIGHQGLGDEVVATIKSAEVTADGLRDGLSARKEVLSRGQPPSEADELLKEISLLRRRVAGARDALEALRHLQKAEDDIEETSSKLELLAASLGGGADEYREIQGRRRVANDEIGTLHVQLAEIDAEVEALGALGDVADLRQSAERLRSNLGQVDVPQLEASIATAQHAVAEANAAVDSAQYRLDRYLLDLQVAASKLSDATWEGSQLWNLDKSLDPDHREQLLGAVGTSVGNELANLDHIAGAADAVLGALGYIAEGFDRSARPAPTSRRYVRAALAHYQDEFADHLNTPELRRALFDAADVVEFDIESMSVTWQVPGTADRMSRPLEAFSSGENAFAYTRFKLEQSGQRTAENRVVFLDEFGAFVARDRRDDLMAFIRRRALGEIADKVVVILPLSTLPRGAEAQAAISTVGYLVQDES